MRQLDAMQAYIDSVKRIPLLTREEEAELGLRCMAGDMDARHELARRNQRLAVAMARQYARYAPREFDDLMGEANAGLFRATQDFDPALARFSTHASYRILSTLRYYIRQKMELVRISMDAVEIRARVVTGKPLDARQAKTWAKVGKYAMARTIIYGNAGDDDEFGHYDLLDEVEAPDSPEPNYDPELCEWLRERLAAIPERTRSMIRDKFFGELELQDIGKRHGVSGKRVQQILEAALMQIQSEMPDWMLKAGPYPVRAIVKTSNYSKMFRSLGRMAS